MSSFFKPNKHRKGFSMKPKGAVNDRLREAVSRMDSQMSMRAASPIPGPESSNLVIPARRSCPNQQCPNPSAPIDDGFCTGCGRQIERDNIVAEIQFSENSSGGAVVQGSFIGADQGAARSMGPGMRRIGGSIGDTRERTVREAKQMMQQYAQQLKLSDSVVNEGVQVFKLAISQNWIQGRGMIKVVPVCLYAACRRQDRCRVMLIDFADLVKVNVYELGHVFKALNDIYDFSHNKIKSIIPEDLMYRFADKLDFGDMTKDVAELAARFCQRMGLDWMTMGRRPSGICGACIFLAAQVWGFRRTVREIVYIVKVTMHTIEQRLDEFKVVESSEMTIEDFLKQELLESRHDPPSFYKKQSEWMKKLEKEREEKGRKRKRIEDIDGDEDEDENEQSPPSGTPPLSETSGNLSTPRATPGPTTSMPPPPIPTPMPPPDMSKLPQVSQYLKKSVDPLTGATIIEAFDPDNIPAPAPKIAAEKEVAEGVDAEDPTGEDALDHLADAYDDEAKAGAPVPTTKRRRGKRVPVEPLLTFNDEWEQSENVLVQQMDEVISDPSSDEHRKALATAAYHARVKAVWARSQLPAPSQELKMDEVIDPSEFADDPEVENCMLGPDEIEIKELIWLNANKDWLRKQQDKEFRKAMDELGPKKKKRNRQKRPRIGEGQLTPASTPADAAAAMASKFSMSNRINIDAIRNLFPANRSRAGPGSVVQSSRAGSEAPESEAGDGEEQSKPKVAAKGKGKDAQKAEEPADDEEEDDEEDHDIYDDDEQGYEEYPEYEEGVDDD